MREQETRGVEEWTLQTLHRANVSGDTTMDPAVHRVADDRVADRAQMHADLMRAAGMNRHLTKREPRHVVRPRDPRDRAARMFRSRRHLLTVHRIAPDRRVDPSSGLDN